MVLKQEEYTRTGSKDPCLFFLKPVWEMKFVSFCACISFARGGFYSVSKRFASWMRTRASVGETDVWIFSFVHTL